MNGGAPKAGKHPGVAVVGHICLDLIPAFAPNAGGLRDLLIPGKLVDVGPPVISTGGAVSNTGLALHRLGLLTRLIGKVGDDLFGRAILDLVDGYGASLADGMIVEAGASTSYTVVISPPGIDRIFLHSPGANDTFRPDDLPVDRLKGTNIVHFGYPPLMRLTYSDGGVALARLFERLRARGIFVSLDMAQPDPESEAGKVDWGAWLARVLPHVDLFGPSLDEILFMLCRDRFEAWLSGQPIGGQVLGRIGEQLLHMGARIVALKLGENGLYVRTSGMVELPHEAGASTLLWRGRELLAPCFQVTVQGTTGSGDCTLAGLLAGLVHGQTPEEAVLSAVGVGACSVESADATSGIPSWDAVQERIRQGWSRHALRVDLNGWRYDKTPGLYYGPNDYRLQAL